MEKDNYFVHSSISTVISIEKESVSISHEKASPESIQENGIREALACFEVTEFEL